MAEDEKQAQRRTPTSAKLPQVSLEDALEPVQIRDVAQARFHGIVRWPELIFALDQDQLAERLLLAFVENHQV